MIITIYTQTSKKTSVWIDKAVGRSDTGGNITYLSAHWSRGIMFVWGVRGPGVERSGQASAVSRFRCSVADLMSDANMCNMS